MYTLKVDILMFLFNLYNCINYKEHIILCTNSGIILVKFLAME